jgi:hypothetical protein
VPIIDAVQIVGLREFRRSLREIGPAAPRALRIAGNQAADMVVTTARGKMPNRSGRARASVKAKSTQSAVKITSGGARAPYVPWLDYGGRVGPNRSVHRTFIADGRYVYPAYHQEKAGFETLLRQALQQIAADAGIVLDVADGR